jgi:hypothetical protein
MYECKKCGKCFDHESRLLKHYDMSSECTLNLKVQEKYTKNLPKCDICKKFFSTVGNFKRHQENNGKCGIVLAVKEEVKGVKEEVKNALKNIQSGPVTNIQNIINEIMLSRPGKERINHITKDVMLELLKCPSFKLISENLIKAMYFNRKVPENSNWTIAYPLNDRAALIYNYDTGQFVRKNTKEIINEKFQNMIDLLQPLIEEIYKEDEEKDHLSNIQKRNLKLYYGYFGVDNIYEEAPDIYEGIHRLAYEYRAISMAYWKQLGYTGNHLSIKF